MKGRPELPNISFFPGENLLRVWTMDGHDVIVLMDDNTLIRSDGSISTKRI